MEVGVHAGFEDLDAAQLFEFGGMGVVVEGAGDHHIKPGISGFFGGIDQVEARDGAKFGADEDPGAFFGLAVAFEVAALGADVVTGPAGEGGKGDFVAFVGLLHPGGFEGFEDDAGKVGFVAAAVWFGLVGVDEFVVLVYGEDAVGGEAFDGEGASHPDDGFVFVGFVVEKFLIGTGGDGGVNLALAGNAGFPEGIEGSLGAGGPVGGRFAGHFPFQQSIGGGGFAGGQRDRAAGSEVDLFAVSAAGGEENSPNLYSSRKRKMGHAN